MIPEEERMNPARKRLQMLALEEAMHEVRMHEFQPLTLSAVHTPNRSHFHFPFFTRCA